MTTRISHCGRNYTCQYRLPTSLLLGATALALLLSTNVMAAPKLVNIGPVRIDYGSVRAGSKVTVPVVVRNLTNTTVSFAGGGFNTFNGHFGAGGTCGGSLAANAVCEFRYTFRPGNGTGTAIENATAISVSNGVTAQSVTLNFTGVGFGSMLDVHPRSIDFGEVFIGETVTVPVRVFNPTADALSFSGGGFNLANGFSANGGTCGGALAAGASCFFNYRITPSMVGEITNQTSFTATTAAPIASQSYPLSVRGTGVNTVGLVQAAPVSMDFGMVRVGSSVVTPFLFTNISSTQINFAGGGFSAQSSDNGAFSGGLGGGAGCTSSTANSGSSCAINYRFAPKEIRDHVGSTTVSFFRTGQNQAVALNMTGQGVGTAGQLSATEIDLGEILVGTQHSTRITLTNTTDSALTNFVGGNLLNPFSATDNCPASLAPGASCEYTISFSASASSIGPRQSQTAISFTNAAGLQPVFNLTVRATGFDSYFRNGFEN